MEKKLIAFYGDKKIKEKYIARVKAHAEADEIVKGKYWEHGKGCAVGCTIEGSDHYLYEKELGIPAILAYLEDGLFEELSNKEAMKFPLKFLEAIPVGADLSKVFAKFVIWEWEDKKTGLKAISEIAGDKELMDCCEQVVALYKRFLNDEEIAESEWQKVEDLAYEIERAWARARARARARAWAGAEYQKEIMVSANKLLEILENTK